MINRKLVFLIVFVLQTLLCQAKIVITPGYGFGFAASFRDSTVYFTEIQYMDSLFMEDKSKLVIGTENFSSQLKEYMESQLDETDRTCVFFYNTKQSALEEQRTKLWTRYANPKKGQGHFIMKTIKAGDFAFCCVDMSDQMDARSKAFEEKRKQESKTVAAGASSRKPIKQKSGPKGGPLGPR